MEELTLKNLISYHEKVKSSSNYGEELKLIKRVFNDETFKKTTNIDKIALKISLIDTTNSTNLSRYKSKISLYELAKHIKDIKNFDARVAQGD